MIEKLGAKKDKLTQMQRVIGGGGGNGGGGAGGVEEQTMDSRSLPDLRNDLKNAGISDADIDAVLTKVLSAVTATGAPPPSSSSSPTYPSSSLSQEDHNSSGNGIGNGGGENEGDPQGIR